MGRRGSKGIWRNESGATAALYALALPMLVAVGGVGFDYARLAGMDSELQNAADQAALAAVTQLDGKTGACSRAASLASGIVNQTLLANDGHAGLGVDVPNESACDATGVIRFWTDEDGIVAATADANANYVEIVLAARTANYALTPVVGAFSGSISAKALAGMSGAICGTSALYYCNANLPVGFNADSYKGYGVMLGTKTGSGSWGFLQVPPGNKMVDTEEALAHDKPQIECRPDSSSLEALPGSESSLIRAINTRFDVFDKNITNNNQPCENKTDCAPAANVLKDMVKGTGKNDDWVFAANQFSPGARNGAYSNATIYDADGVDGSGNLLGVDAMGLPRDLCHYASYGYACHNYHSGYTNDTLGSGEWARADYFKKYHSGRTPLNAGSMTRYETYKWEIANGYHTALNGSNAGGSTYQYSLPVNITASTSSFDRRVVTVGISRGNGTSCPGANDPIPIIDWVDMFFVEPANRNRGNYDFNPNSSDPIYMEIIGRSSRGGAGGPQLTRRDMPYLVE